MVVASEGPSRSVYPGSPFPGGGDDLHRPSSTVHLPGLCFLSPHDLLLLRCVANYLLGRLPAFGSSHYLSWVYCYCVALREKAIHPHFFCCSCLAHSYQRCPFSPTDPFPCPAQCFRGHPTSSFHLLSSHRRFVSFLHLFQLEYQTLTHCHVFCYSHCAFSPARLARQPPTLSDALPSSHVHSLVSPALSLGSFPSSSIDLPSSHHRYLSFQGCSGSSVEHSCPLDSSCEGSALVDSAEGSSPDGMAAHPCHCDVGTALLHRCPSQHSSSSSSSFPLVSLLLPRPRRDSDPCSLRSHPFGPLLLFFSPCHGLAIHCRTCLACENAFGFLHWCRGSLTPSALHLVPQREKPPQSWDPSSRCSRLP